MTAAKSPGTWSRWASTWRACRTPSQMRHATAASTKTMKMVLKREAVTLRYSSGPMANDKTPLVWIDMEMSGLVPERDRILEVAMVVTDSELNAIAEAPVMVVHQ